MATIGAGIPDDQADVSLARAAIGENARPTGRLRMLGIDGSRCRLQYEWQGDYGRVWFDIPLVYRGDGMTKSPPRAVQARASALLLARAAVVALCSGALAVRGFHEGRVVMAGLMAVCVCGAVFVAAAAASLG